MHEAGLARGVANALRERGLLLEQVRLLVRGGLHEPAAFEAALREHLAREFPAEAEAARTIRITREPFGHLCVSCGAKFDAAEVHARCPRCDGDTISAVQNEQIEIVLAEVPA